MNSLLSFHHPEVIIVVLFITAGAIWLVRGQWTRTAKRAMDDQTQLKMLHVFTASLDLDEVGQSIVQRVYETVPLHAVSLFRWEPVKNQASWLAHFPGPTFALADRLVDSQHDAIRVALESMRVTDLVLADDLAQPVMMVPMVVREQSVGLLAAWPDLDHPLSSDERDLVTQIAQLAAHALRNVLTFALTDAALRERVIELSTIEVVSRHISATLDQGIITSDVLAAAMSAIDAERGNCALVSDPQHYALVARFDERGTQLKTPLVGSLEQGIIGQVLRTSKPVVLSDDAGNGAEVPRVQSQLCVPILREGKAIGALSFEDSRANVFTEAHLRFVTTLAEHAAGALENARLFSEGRRQIETLVNLRKLSLDLLSSTDLQSMMTMVVEYTQLVTHAADVCLYVRAEDDDNPPHLVAHNLTGNPRRCVADDQPAVIQQVMDTGQPYYSAPLPFQPVYYSLKPPEFEALVFVPIRRAGLIFGAFAVVFTDPHYYTQNEIQALDLLANQAGVAIDNMRLHEVVRTGRDQLQAILDTTPEAVLLFDRDGRFLKFNPAAEEMLGYELAPYQGHSFLTWLRSIGAVQLEKQTGFSLQHFRQYLMDVQRSPTRITRRQFEQVRQGETRFIIETGSPVLDQQGQPAGWLLLWRDNTEERKLELVRQELSSMIVHDLRNPLTSITNSLKLLMELLSEGATGEDVFAEVIQIAQTSAGNTLNLVQSLLDVARLEHDSMSLQCTGLPLAEVVDIALVSVMGLSMGSGIEIHTDLDADLPLVWIDDEKIQRVLVNLLDNSLRHTPYGGHIHITARYCSDEDAVIVRVSDNGPGIPIEVRDRIFDKFIQLDHQTLRGHKGTGLGLTFCKLAIEAHRGRIWVEDAVEGGASFCFTLPVVTERHSFPESPCR